MFKNKTVLMDVLASMLNIYAPTASVLPENPCSDAEMLSKDWQLVGLDIDKAIEAYRLEHGLS